MYLVSGSNKYKAKGPDNFLRPQPSNHRESAMSLFTLVSSLLRPTTPAQRVQRQGPRTRLNLEALEDRRLLSHGFGLDDVQPVEIERPEPSGDTPSLSRGLDDTAALSRGLDDNTLGSGGVSDRRGRGNEGETGGGHRHGQGGGPTGNTPKGHRHHRHEVGEHVIKVLHA
jgi:hypothetical protein